MHFALRRRGGRLIGASGLPRHRPFVLARFGRPERLPRRLSPRRLIATRPPLSFSVVGARFGRPPHRESKRVCLRGVWPPPSTVPPLLSCWPAVLFRCWRVLANLERRGQVFRGGKCTIIACLRGAPRLNHNTALGARALCRAARREQTGGAGSRGAEVKSDIVASREPRASGEARGTTGNS